MKITNISIKLVERYLAFAGNEMNYKGSGKVHFGVDDVSLYGTPKEEPGPGLPGQEVKQSFLKNQLQALFQPTDNKLAMKLFGSKKALMKERIRQKAAGHWVIHPCSSFRWVLPAIYQIASPWQATDEISISRLDSGCFLIMFDPRYIILSIDRVMNDLCQFFYSRGWVMSPWIWMDCKQVYLPNSFKLYKNLNEKFKTNYY